ncbi:sigma-54 interaction domain-containing protein [Brevibacillus fluminis]|nr:sigma 54-interacting transcriptional regulator [Brevibacillus fluminis]
MLEHIRLNHDWLLHPLKQHGPLLFSHPQLRLIEAVLEPDAVDSLTKLIREQLDTLTSKGVIELDAPPLRFLLIKDKTKSLLAVSMRDQAAQAPPPPEPVQTFDFAEETLADNTQFVANSQAMINILDIIKKVSYVNSTILLLGESGVGKGAIAKLIHSYSSRADERFVSINCGAIPEALMEAELFGYAHGSFTGGQKGGKAGLFEAANCGTIFLDEIGELPPNLQVKLLHVLQESQIRRIGSAADTSINVRVIAATNQNLKELVAQKKFRNDLYYRLNVVPIEIPSLCERREDIEGLARYFLKKYNNKHRASKTIHPDVIQAFLNYHWPGNVRELENMLERLVVTVERTEIQLAHLPAAFQSIAAVPSELQSPGDELIPLKEAIWQLEKKLITQAYLKHKSTYKAALALGIDQSTVAKKLKQFRQRKGDL